MVMGKRLKHGKLVVTRRPLDLLLRGAGFDEV
jgi:hypothetical protein